MISSTIQVSNLSQFIARLILTLKIAINALLLLYNKRYFTLFFLFLRTMQKRQSTLALEIRFFARIILSLDRLSNNYNLRFVFNSNKETYNILLYNESSKDNIN